MAPQKAVIAQQSEVDQDVDVVLYRIVMGRLATLDELRKQIVVVAEANGMTYAQVVKRLQERFTLHHQTGEYTDEMIGAIPAPLKSALALDVEA